MEITNFSEMLANKLTITWCHNSETKAGVIYYYKRFKTLMKV